jgi:hypothetical protein
MPVHGVACTPEIPHGDEQGPHTLGMQTRSGLDENSSGPATIAQLCS